MELNFIFNTKNKKDIYSIIFIIIAIIIFFNKIIFTDEVYFIGDIYTQFFPWKTFLKNSIENKSVPFWSPFNYSGTPFIADIQKAAFYPPGIIFYIFDFPIAFKIYILIHFFILGISSYYLLKSFGFRSISSVIGCFIILFNSFTVTRINFIGAIASYSLFPLILLEFKKFLSIKNYIRLIYLSILLSLCFLAGHPPVFFYNLLFLSFYLIYYLKTSKTNIFNVKTLLKSTIFLFVFTLFFLFLTMPQSGLFFDFVKNTSRFNMEYTDITADSVSFSDLLSFILLGKIFGTKINPLIDWHDFSMGIMNFFSITLIFLLSLSIFYPKNEFYKFNIFIILIALFLSLGKNTPVHSWFYAFVPFFKTLRHPGFAIQLIVLPLAFITAYTIDNIRLLTPVQLSLFENQSPLSKLRNFFDTRFSKKTFWILVFFVIILLLMIFNFNTILNIYNLTQDKIYDFIHNFLIFIAIFALNILLFFFFEKNKISKKFYLFLIGFLIFSELFTIVSPLNPTINSSIYNYKTFNNSTINSIKSISYKFMHTEKSFRNRMYSGKTLYDAQLNFLSHIPPETGILYNLYDASGYNPLILKKYEDFISDIFSGDTINNPEKLNLINVKYLITCESINIKNFILINELKGRKIYKNTNALPLFYISKQNNKIEQIVSQISWSRKAESDYNIYNITVNSGEDGYFIFSNNYYDGWNVYIDNKQAKIEKAFDLFMCVKLPKGYHNVIFSYYPKNLKFYIFLFYFIIFVLIGQIIIYMYFKFEKNYSFDSNTLFPKKFFIFK
ncbi:MAG: YfhO family protein [Candidatus Goldbacteria bacterium]|nr:YfhO family protein [Candidatus Goldiibacteriota bacterium]